MVPNPFDISGKVILVTGASSGIGRQVAISASNMGAQVILTGRNKARLEETQGSIEGESSIIAADITIEEERQNLVTTLPNLDGIVHCAGVVKPFPIKYLSQEKVDETLNVNYESIVLLMAGITKHKKLNKNASIIYMSSISGQHPHKGGALYAGSKAAIEAFSKVTALELYPKGIRSNCISPAMVKTAMYAEAEKDMSKASMDEHVAKYPLGVGYPEDVANTVIFLLSPASRWISGVNITLDGGFLLEGGA